jgi:glycosyltransferase involved in cell wall biosynthesis
MRTRVPNIIAISPYVRQVIKPNPLQRIWDIDNPVSDAYFEIAPQPVVGRVLFAGKIIPLKNVAGLIQGFAEAAKHKPECELRLAGPETDPSYAAHCRALAAQLGIADRVKLLGSLSIDEMKGELARASFLTLCSFQENAPLVISEAMAAGLPVVASRVGGIPWMVSEGVTGYRVDPTLDGDIARGLRLSLENRELGQMGARAKAIAEQRFRTSAVANRTREAYGQILRSEQTG